MFESIQRDCWQAINARSTLAAILLEQKKYAEAELLLVSAYCGFEKPENLSSAALKPRLKKTIPTPGASLRGNTTTIGSQ